MRSGDLQPNDKRTNSGYKEGMNEALSRRLSQPQFADPMQEALLSLLVAATTLNDLMDELCEMRRITRPQYNVLRILRGVHPGGHARCEIARRMIDRAPMSLVWWTVCRPVAWSTVAGKRRSAPSRDHHHR